MMESRHAGSGALNTLMRGTPVVLACAAAVSCGTGQPAVESQIDNEPAIGTTDTSTSTDSPARVPLTCDDLHDEILKVPATRQAFSAEFGRPDSVISSVEPNRHVPDAVDSLFVVHYPGLVMDIRTPEGARDMAAHVRVDDNRYLAYPAIGIGATAERIEEVLGEPRERGDGYLTYQCGIGAEQPVRFSISDGRVTAIDIAYYVD
jgi:hypothetical protein